jgi:P27 family predicted phage terminase small subunit
VARRGRKPTPTRLQILRGVAPGRITFDAPDPGGRPEAPDDLSPEAREEWNRVVDELVRVGATRVDQAALILYVQTWEVRERARAAVQKHGMLVTGGTGGLKINPAVPVELQATKQLLAILAEFGGTPSSRTRLHTLPATHGTGDPIDDFLDAETG